MQSNDSSSSSMYHQNVWANNEVDINDEEIISGTLIVESPDPMSSIAPITQGNETRLHSPGPVVGPVRRHYEDIDKDESTVTVKRVAVSGPRQRLLDDLREREEISRRRAVEQGVRFRNKNTELEQLRQEYQNSLRQNGPDPDMESQMVEQILQYEKEINDLSSKNDHLAAMVQRGEEQFHKMREHNEEITRKLQEMAAEHARAQERSQTEFLALRQRLESAEASRTPAASVSTRGISRNTFRRSDPANITIIPLRPASCTTSPEPSSNAIPRPVAEEDIDVNLDTEQGVHHIKAVVKEVLEQLQVKTVTVADRHATRKRRSARVRNQEAIEHQKQSIAKAENLAWRDAIRSAWKSYYNVTSMDDFGEYEPAPLSEVEAFESGGNGPGESITLDFSKGFERSRWNKVILTRLSARILEERQTDGNWGLPDVSRDYLMAVLASQLKRAREAWRLVQARPNYTERRMETVTEVVQRIEEYTNMRLTSVGSRSRKERKYERRTKAVEKVICLKSQSNAPDLATWKYFCELLRKLSVDGMSSEEEGVDKIGNVNVPVFYVKLCTWRHPAISNYFKYIDQESQNPAIRPNRGSKLHPRIPTTKESDSPAPRKLPIKLFNEEWLKKMEDTMGKEWIDDELIVSQDVFELLQFSAP